ncbi:hypothetical protein MVEG_08704 [Podila verticillata NRRL 6337]|nr:hypothetical protein MVEG_08704 [Podila verticillata NRRL 6337]
MTPNLWQDVVTFYKEQDNNRVYHRSRFLSGKSQKALFKNAHHIRSLTCRGDLLPVLVEAKISNLVELNYMVGMGVNPPLPMFTDCLAPPGPTPPDPSFTALLKLIVANPQLRSLSIKNAMQHRPVDNRLFWPLQEFFRSLTSSSSSSMPRLYLGGLFMPSDVPMSSTLSAVLKWHLLNVEGSKVTKLELKRTSHSARFQRGLSSLAVVEIEGYYPREKRRVPYDHAVEAQNSLGVFKNNGALTISAPYSCYLVVIESMLKRFPDLRCLSVDYFTEGLGRHLRYIMPASPSLRDIKFGRIGTWDEDLAESLGPDLKLDSVSLGEMKSDLYSGAIRPLLLRDTPHFLRHALAEVTFSPSLPLLMSSLLELLAACPRMRTLSVPIVQIDGSEPDVSPVWACQQLQTLSLGLYTSGYRIHSKTIDQVFAVSSASAEKIAPSFMQQLGQQRCLQDLQLLLRHTWRGDWSPFLDLSMGCTNGLEQLAELSQLEKVAISGLMHSVEETEIAWMVRHWPRIALIRIPAPTTMSYVSDARQPDYMNLLRLQKIRFARANVCKEQINK